jgi:putative secretion ATPase (PEP-CTERM system associated)
VYEKFYHLTGLPFLLTPDRRFFFGSSGHSRAISHLVYGLSQEEGFVVITGEVGAGKTTLVEQLWAQLDRNTYVMSRVVTTRVSGDDLLRLALAGFGMEAEIGSDKATLLVRFEQMVRERRKQGRRLLLLVDEVQNLPLSALEELRMLSNITVDGKASVQTILLGQPQFRAMMAIKDAEQLRQRVLASYHLGPLTDAETRGYIEHRLRTVGWKDDPSWDDEAFLAIHRQTGGIPRRINTLCSRVLLLGSLEEAHRITADMVDATASELNEDLGAGGVALAEPAERVPPSSGEIESLVNRVVALELREMRQRVILKRLLDILEAKAAQ